MYACGRFGHSVIGIERDTNNDFYLVDPENALFVVADGSSDHNAGNIASQRYRNHSASSIGGS